MEDSGAWYRLWCNGYVLTGWFRSSYDLNGDLTPSPDGKGAWYFADEGGRTQRGSWCRDSRDWCYTDPTTGEMWISKWVKGSQGWCFIGPWGAPFFRVCYIPSTIYG